MPKENVGKSLENPKISTAKKRIKKVEGADYRRVPSSRVRLCWRARFSWHSLLQQIEPAKKDLKKDFFKFKQLPQLWLVAWPAAALSGCRICCSNARANWQLSKCSLSNFLPLSLAPFHLFSARLVFIFILCPLASGTLTGTCIQSVWQPFKSEVSFRFVDATPPALSLALWLLSLSIHTHFPFQLATLFCILKIFFFPFFAVVSRVVHTPLHPLTLCLLRG